MSDNVSQCLHRRGAFRDYFRTRPITSVDHLLPCKSITKCYKEPQILPSVLWNVSKYWLNGHNKGNIKNQVRSKQEAANCRGAYSTSTSPTLGHTGLARLPAAVWTLESAGHSGSHHGDCRFNLPRHWSHHRHTLSVLFLRQRPSLCLGF